MKTGFPILILITNIPGAVLIGFVVGLVSKRDDISPNTVLFWKTGVCGGFATLSSYSLEAFSLIDNHHMALGGIYMVASVGFRIVGIMLGRQPATMMA